MKQAAALSSEATRTKILDAAEQVCARDGLQGATTREIAIAAQVNEVTLFRHFGSKQKLIAELFARSMAAQVESLANVEPDVNDLEHDLRRYAERLNRMLFDHEPLIRTLIGEAHRQPDAAKQVISDAVKPLRARLMEYLQAAQTAGSVRKGLAIEPTVDAFSGMLLAGMLRRTSLSKCFNYSQDEYLAASLDLFLRGIVEPGAVQGK